MANENNNLVRGLGAGLMQQVRDLELLDDAGNVNLRFKKNQSSASSGDIIGFQSVVGGRTTGTATVYGAQITPRFNDAIAGASLVGLHAEAYLKGTTGNLSGDVRAQELELTTDDAATRTISGNVIGLRIRMAFSGTVSGKCEAIRIEKPEVQTNSKNYDYALVLTGDNGLIWKDDFTTEVTTLSGAIKVQVNGADRWLPLYSGAPSV